MKELKNACIIFPLRGREVLLAKKAGKIGAGCWNGYGGEIEDGETAAEAAVRELRQESGLIARAMDCEQVAHMTFYNFKEDNTFTTCRCPVFVVRSFRGEPCATDEMLTPRWFPTYDLPVSGMMPADKSWVPLVLIGWKIVGEAWYGPRQKTLLRKTKVRYVSGFD